MQEKATKALVIVVSLAVWFLMIYWMVGVGADAM